MISDKTRARILESKQAYQTSNSALLPALYAVQEEEGYVSEEGMLEISRILGVPHSDVIGVATFYTMLPRNPQGQFVINVCTTLSCALLGAEQIVDYLSRKLGIKVGETTPDGLFTFSAVQCLGNCGKSPVMMVGDKNYENLTYENVDAILESHRQSAESLPADPGKDKD